METVWFCLVSIMLAVYVLLDGFDLGAGAIHLLVAKTNEEKRQVLASIGPVWDGNEVWLIAACDTLFFAFPVLYASSFSGFYLPITMVLSLLILRGISVEFRSHLKNPLWAPLWDFVFCGASVLLAIFYGVALGNVVRGVPLDASGYFFEALWTNFRFGTDAGILDWYTILVGLAAYFALAEHGALWVAHKTEDALRDRARRMARIGWWGVALSTVIVTLITFRVQPHIMSNLSAHPVGFVFPLLAIAGLASTAFFLRSSPSPSPSRDTLAFFGSSTYLAGMLSSAAFGLYPYLLPSLSSPSLSLSIYNVSNTPYALSIALAWWLLALTLALSYFTFLYRSFSGKGSPVPPDTHSQ